MVQDVDRDTLRVSEIFHSIQGESLKLGLPTVFVRLTGCPLRCAWCDTSYAFSGGQHLKTEDILHQIQKYATPHITVTGGEPLAQKNCLRFLNLLCDAGYSVSLETSGALPITEVDRRVTKIVDIKPPSSKESHRNRDDLIEHLKTDDQLKFVIGDRLDYEWAKKTLATRGLSARCEVLFAPVWQQLPARQLAEWILQDRLSVRLQPQLHKFLWGDVPGR